MFSSIHESPDVKNPWKLILLAAHHGGGMLPWDFYVTRHEDEGIR